VFFNFAPSFVRRWVPSVWSQASPASLIEARAAAAARTLVRLYPDIAGVAARCNPVLRDAVARGAAAGRPLFAANQQLSLSDDPVAELWQLCTSLREHRGDGHVAVLASNGLDGIEAHVMIAIDHGNSATDLQKTRGWPADDWSSAVDRCAQRRWIAPLGGLSRSGQQMRTSVETATDRLAARPFDAMDPESRDALLNALAPAALAVSRSGAIRYPNPIGLPAIHKGLV
jgi:hypothetical protein